MRDDDNLEALDGMELQVADNVESVDGMEVQVADNVEAKPKSLLKNWQLMSSIIVYCIFSLYDTAYSEVNYIEALLNISATS
jgi:hypothetical protein